MLCGDWLEEMQTMNAALIIAIIYAMNQCPLLACITTMHSQLEMCSYGLYVLGKISMEVN